MDTTVNKLSLNGEWDLALKELEKTQKAQLEVKKVIRLVKNEKQLILHELKKYEQLFCTYNQLQSRLVQLLNKNQSLCVYKLDLFKRLKNTSKQMKDLIASQTDSQTNSQTEPLPESSSANIKPVPYCLQKPEIKDIEFKAIPKEVYPSELRLLPELTPINRHRFVKTLTNDFNEYYQQNNSNQHLMSCKKIIATNKYQPNVYRGGHRQTKWFRENAIPFLKNTTLTDPNSVHTIRPTDNSDILPQNSSNNTLNDKKTEPENNFPQQLSQDISNVDSNCEHLAIKSSDLQIPIPNEVQSMSTSNEKGDKSIEIDVKSCDQNPKTSEIEKCSEYQLKNGYKNTVNVKNNDELRTTETNCSEQKAVKEVSKTDKSSDKAKNKDKQSVKEKTCFEIQNKASNEEIQMLQNLRKQFMKSKHKSNKKISEEYSSAKRHCEEDTIERSNKKSKTVLNIKSQDQKTHKRSSSEHKNRHQIESKTSEKRYSSDKCNKSENKKSDKSRVRHSSKTNGRQLESKKEKSYDSTTDRKNKHKSNNESSHRKSKKQNSKDIKPESLKFGPKQQNVETIEPIDKSMETSHKLHETIVSNDNSLLSENQTEQKQVLKNENQCQSVSEPNVSTTGIMDIPVPPLAHPLDPICLPVVQKPVVDKGMPNKLKFKLKRNRSVGSNINQNDNIFDCNQNILKSDEKPFIQQINRNQLKDELLQRKQQRRESIIQSNGSPGPQNSSTFDSNLRAINVANDETVTNKYLKTISGNISSVNKSDLIIEYPKPTVKSSAKSVVKLRRADSSHQISTISLKKSNNSLVSCVKQREQTSMVSYQTKADNKSLKTKFNKKLSSVIEF